MSEENNSTVSQDSIKVETKWQQFWDDNKTFQPQVTEQSKQKPKFFATVPYPYANSALHIGHGRTFTTADIFVRYQRLLGKHVLYPMGFHISGTPVLAVADGIKKKDPKQLKLTRDAIAEYVKDEAEQNELLESFKDPMKIADFFSSKIEETFNSIGLSIDWTRQFTTGDESYKQFIRWQYKKLKEAGVLVQGKYPILYSPADNNAVGEDDIKDGDTDKVSVQEMKYIKFQLTGTSGNPEFLVAATLRPDSLFGATNLYVKPDMDLVKLEVNEGNGNTAMWIVAKAAQTKIENQFENVKVISEHTGQDFIAEDAKVIVPILNTEVPIYPMEYPDEDHGTGIVYSSPADSPHDYIYLFELKFPGKSLREFNEDPLNLTPITQTFDKKKNEITYKSNIPAFDKLHKFKIFNVEGNENKLEQAKEELYKEAHYGAIMINSGEFDNTPLKNNVGANKVKEKLEELKLGGTFYETSRRATTRSGDTVIVANLQGQWFLDYSADKVKNKARALLDTMEYVPQNLKQTQLGYLNWVQKRPCARRRGIGTPLPDDPEWIIEPLSDSTIYQMYYFLANYVETKQLAEQDITEDLLDYVFLNKDVDSASLPACAEQLKADVEYWNCCDFRYTTPPHMSNHLSFLIYHYALILPQKFHPKNITVGGLLIKDGQKISKSKGNGIPLIKVKELYGADVYRLYVAVAASFDSEMDFREDEIQMLNKRFSRWKELIGEAIKLKPKQESELSDINKWLISKFYSRAKQYQEHMENYKFREAYIAILYEFLNDINYHERRTSTDETITVLANIAQDYLRIMTPVTPHICEEFNARGKHKDTPISLQEIHIDETKINEAVEDIEEITQSILTQVPNIAQRKGESFTKIILTQATDTKFKLFDELTELLSKTREFKTIMQTLNEKFPEEKKFIQRFVPKTLSDGLQAYLPKDLEKGYLESVKPFLEKEFCKTIELADNATNAMPGKPSILLE